MADLRTIYALLVGINDYQSRTIRSLHGCVADVAAMEAYLTGRVNQDASSGFRLALRKLVQAEATRQAIIDGFREHLGRAGSEDVALFYYSGHGSQERAPEALQGFERDGLNETLVCYDSRTEAQPWDLADKELAKLIAELSGAAPHIVVILDSCHAGSGSRGDAWVRLAEANDQPRPLDSYILDTADIKALADTTGGPRAWATGSGRHVLLAACQPEEEAREILVDTEKRGAFSYFLLQSLERSGASTTYDDLLHRTKPLVESRVVRQSPVLEASFSGDRRQPFLGGAIVDSPQRYVASHSASGWTINAGAIHGLPAGAGSGSEQSIELALFDGGALAAQSTRLGEAVARTRVTQVEAERSRIATPEGGLLDPDDTYWAVVTRMELRRRPVYIGGDAAAGELARQALRRAAPADEGEGAPSLYLAETGDPDAAEYCMCAEAAEAADVGPADPAAVESASSNAAAQRMTDAAGGFVLARPQDGRPLAAPIDGANAVGARRAVQQLEHIARWQNLIDLRSPINALPDSAVDVRIDRLTGRPADPRDLSTFPLEPIEGDIRLICRTREDGEPDPARVLVTVANRWNRPLHCQVLLLGPLFDVALAHDYQKEASVLLGPEDSTGFVVGYLIPNDEHAAGITEVRDYIKLFFSTGKFNAASMEQDSLTAPVLRASRSVESPASELDWLMQHAASGSRASSQDDDWSPDAWTTKLYGVTTQRPPAGAIVAAGEGDKTRWLGCWQHP